MSTTVKYNDEVITTLHNQRKVLETSGTWVTDNIEILDGSGGGVYQDASGYLVLSEDGSGGYTIDDIALYTSHIEGDLTLEYSTGVDQYAFYYCSKITSITGKNVLSIGNNCFYNCNKLKTVDFPNLNRLYASGAFRSCTSLEMVCFPKIGINTTVPYMYSTTFYGCKSLEKADLGHVSRISSQDFYNCTSLTELILRRTETEDITVLNNINVFTGTPFASGGSGGTIYVPSALIDSYKSATNWSTLDGYGTVTWVAIENSPYENYSVDGITPVS